MSHTTRHEFRAGEAIPTWIETVRPEEYQQYAKWAQDVVVEAGGPDDMVHVYPTTDSELLIAFAPPEGVEITEQINFKGARGETLLHRPNRKSALRALPVRLCEERGMPDVGVAIWRPDRSEEVMWHGTVGEFLGDPLRLSGRWLIDGGWGGPPGPVAVEWDGEAWRNLGFPPYAEKSV